MAALLLSVCFAIVAAVVIFFARPAHPREQYAGQYAQVDPAVRKWFEGLTNNNGNPCCSLADGHRLDGDDVTTKGAIWVVRVEGQWWDVPADRVVIGKGNPVGEAVVFYRLNVTSAGKTMTIWCFVPPGGV